MRITAFVLFSGFFAVFFEEKAIFSLGENAGKGTREKKSQVVVPRKHSASQGQDLCNFSI
jgi:hypothetical protein